VQVQGLTHDQGLEQVALDLLHGEYHPDDDERVAAALGDQGDDHREDAADRGAEHRDERTEKGDDREGQGQRYAEEEQAGPDAHRVDQRDKDHAADVAVQGGPGPLAGGVDAGAGSPGRPQQQPAPHGGAVLEQEEQHEQHDRQAAEQLERERRPGPRARHGRQHEPDEVVADLVDAVRRQGQRG